MAKFSISAKLKSRPNSDGTHLIQATYLYNRILKEYGTGYSCDKQSWDSVKKLVNPHTTDGVTVNGKIQQVQAVLFQVASKLSDPTHELVNQNYAVAFAEFEMKSMEVNLQKWEAQKQALKAQVNDDLGLIDDMRTVIALVPTYEKAKAAVMELKVKKNRILQRLEDKGIYKKDDHTLSDKTAARKLFYDLSAEYIKEAVDTKSMKPGTIRQQFALFSKLQKFETATGYVMSFDKVGFDFYREFYQWCTVSEGNFDNYYGSLIKRLRTFLTWAADERDIAVNQQFRSKKFKVTKEEHDVIYLKLEELEWLDEFRHHAMCKDSWVRVIDMALVQASVGCRYSDMVNSSWFFEGKMLKGYTIKNKSAYMIPLKSSKWFDILKTYNMTFKMPIRHSDKVGVLSEQKFNKYLKECLQAMYLSRGLHVDDTEKIVKKRTQGGEEKFEYKFKYEFISSHSLRRSFVSRMVRAGYKVEHVATMIGTKSVKELEKYFSMEQADIEAAADVIHFKG